MKYNLELELDEILTLFSYLNTVYYLQKENSDERLKYIIIKLQEIVEKIKEEGI